MISREETEALNSLTLKKSSDELEFENETDRMDYMLSHLDSH
jgi:hypothetical protein